MKCPRCNDANGVMRAKGVVYWCDKCGYTWQELPRQPPKDDRKGKIVKLSDYRKPS